MNSSDFTKSIQAVKRLLPKIVAVVQQEYDDWDESDIDTYANGGICHLISDQICWVLSTNGFDCGSVSAQVGDQHVWTIVKADEGTFSIDISPYLYERGSGYNWTKVHDVVFQPSDIEITRVGNTNDFEQMIED